MKAAFSTKIGILGGGQLARLLALKCHDLGLTPYILSPQATDPAAQVTAHHFTGDPSDLKALKNFCSHIDYLTFESEFIDVKKLDFLKANKKLKVFPNLKSMGLMQDRLTQKKQLMDAHIHTAAFFEIKSSQDLYAAFSQFQGKMVLKKRRGGYDGYGTFVIKSLSRLKQWEPQYFNSPDEWIAEAWVPFKRECAFSMARNASGEMVTLPLVETHQKDNRCDIVTGPIQHPKLNKLIAHCAHFLEDMNYIGIMAFELFDTGKDLIINEVAPRVHNSAHYSLLALNIDQFSLHLKAGLDDIFYAVKPLTPAFVMANLIGDNTKTAEPPLLFEGQLCWYGKQENRKGRKMGHVNYAGKNTKTLLGLAKKERGKFKNIQK